LCVGSDMDESLRLAGDGLVPVGYVADLAEIFGRVRVTVAPLAFGAGIKGKVLESFAGGVPCVCTPIAAEGLDLPEKLRICIAESPATIAATLQRLHEDEALNAACRAAGLDYVATELSETRIDAQMRSVLGLSQGAGASEDAAEERRAQHSG